MELRYAGDDKLFVPLERLDLVQKYTGGATPALDKLGGTTWEKAEDARQEGHARHGRGAAEALRRAQGRRRPRVQRDTHWQQEFDDAFEYDLTPDQQTAIRDITRDMETSTPMDRLLCGDVGYGKTEVAMRAAFKAVMDGKQVAFLAPTTVLAFQHLRTLRERFAGFPVSIDMISRFRTKQEQKTVVAHSPPGSSTSSSARTGCCRRTSTFRDLGLLVVDEEQRFGVAHKERIKQLRKKVDVLTMTATPIPRTLNMSLVGIRDMSVIETPPRDRLSIQTHVVQFDQDVDRASHPHRARTRRPGVLRPQPRRVDLSMANLVPRLVPEAKLAVAHGQMGEDDARARDGGLRRAEVRRAGRDDDRRERPGHSEREHDHHQPRRPVRPGAALPAARTRRPRPIAARTPTC